MTTVTPVQCYACSRLQRSQTLPFSDRPVLSACGAFPAGIPDAMRYGADHREPIGGETAGLLFVQAGGDEAADAFRWWRRVFGDGSTAAQASYDDATYDNFEERR